MHVSAIGSPIGKVQITDDFGAHLERFRRALAVAGMLDTPRIRIFSFFIPQGEDAGAVPHRRHGPHADDDRTRRSEAGMTLLHENEKDIYGDIATRCADIHTTIPSPHLRAAFDPANFIQCGVRPMDEAWPLLADVSTHIHIKDAVMADKHVVPAGQGDGQVKRTAASAGHARLPRLPDTGAASCRRRGRSAASPDPISSTRRSRR